MLPYSSFPFFIFLLVCLLPAIILGFRGKTIKWYAYFLSVLFIGVIYGENPAELLSIIGYTFYQWLLILLTIRFRNRLSVYRGFIILSIFPLFMVKAAPILAVKTTIGFLGISYLTFKSVQMIIETKEGLIKEIKLHDFIRFLLFMPTITSGPIDRYRRFLQEEETPLPPNGYSEWLYLGIHRIFQGFLYKFVVAYLIDKYWLSLDFLHHQQVGKVMHSLYQSMPHVFSYTAFIGVISHLSYMYAYSFYLFFDFAGYSAFAIGTSYILGVRTPENFNKPFLSRNIKDFWNRWHMTLSHWLRDYVFMRTVLWLTKKKLTKNRFLISSVGYICLFGLMGVWHGFALHFIVYGCYHAILMIGYDGFEKLNKRYQFWPNVFFTRLVGIFITFQFVCFGFYIFSGKLF